MAMLSVICPDMAQAQTRRTVRRPTASSSQPVSTKQHDASENKRLIHELDSVEALYNDLNTRYENDQANAEKTMKDDYGTEYQVARAVLEGSTLTIYLRLRNLKTSPTLNFQTSGGVIKSTFILDNDEVYQEWGPYQVYVEKGYWKEIEFCKIYNVKTYPRPKYIKELQIKEHNLDIPITFHGIRLQKIN